MHEGTHGGYLSALTDSSAKFLIMTLRLWLKNMKATPRGSSICCVPCTRCSVRVGVSHEVGCERFGVLL